MKKRTITMNEEGFDPWDGSSGYTDEIGQRLASISPMQREWIVALSSQLGIPLMDIVILDILNLFEDGLPSDREIELLY